MSRPALWQRLAARPLAALGAAIIIACALLEPLQIGWALMLGLALMDRAMDWGLA